jgi:hypothetical protein
LFLRVTQPAAVLDDSVCQVRFIDQLATPGRSNYRYAIRADELRSPGPESRHRASDRDPEDQGS